MRYTHPVTELIRARISRRTFEPDTDTHKQDAALANLRAAEPAPPPFGSEFIFSVVEVPDLSHGYLGSLGTYGVIRGARFFLLGGVKESLNALVDFGYAFEQLILKAQDLGLGTCWLGGTFARSRFEELLKPRPHFIMPSISPVGLVPGHIPGRDKMIRFLAGSRNRKPFSTLFFAGDFSSPLTGEAAGPYELPLEMVRLAPSATNRQPWRVLQDRAGRPVFHFFRKRSPLYQAGMRLSKIPDLQLVDMGIAMCHFELSAREQGLAGEWITGGAPRAGRGYEYIVSWRGQ